MVALTAVGETDLMKLKSFAIYAWRGSLQAEESDDRTTKFELAGQRRS